MRSFFLFTYFFSVLVSAQETPMGYSKRAVVFPIDAPRTYNKSLDEAWWKVRETLTDSKRFLVASKRFLIQKDVFQPRTTLSASDSILLGQLLEADSLVTISLKNRDLKLTVYGCADGSVFYANTITLHQSLPIEQQLTETATKLIRDYMASVIYHGVQIVDPLIGKAVYEEGDVKIAKVDVGTSTRAKEGDTVQWIKVERTSSKPLFMGGNQVEVIAEGQIFKSENGILQVEIKRAKDISILAAGTLVRIPAEAEFLQANFALQNSKTLQPELRYNPLPPTKSDHEESRPLVSALATIASVVIFLLLAL